MVDGEKLVVDSRNKGKHTGRNDRREDDVHGRASVIKDGGRCAGGGRCLGGRCPTIAAPADRRQAAMTAAGRLSDSFELRKRASERDLHINDAMSPTAAAAAGLSVAQLMPDSERSGRLSRSNTIVV